MRRTKWTIWTISNENIPMSQPNDPNPHVKSFSENWASDQYEGFILMPSRWEDCTNQQLLWLAENGSSDQRNTADYWLMFRHLQSRAADNDETRAAFKALGPPPEIE